jgi:DNA replication protein DnaC
MFQQILNEAERNTLSLSSEDYEKDGLIYCGKCNTPKQAYVEGFKRNMPVACKCKQERIRKEEEQRERFKKQQRIAELRKHSLLGTRYQDATFDNTITTHSTDFAKIHSRCKRYCEVADEVLRNGTGIYLFGTNGTGKSRLTACMGNELMLNNFTVLYTNFSEIARKLLKDDKFLNQIAEIDFLFIDDFGTEKVTKGSEDAWLQEKVFEVINTRYIEQKPIIFTANYSLKELIEDRGMAKRSVDRIMEMCELMRLDGQSYRVTAMKQRERLF